MKSVEDLYTENYKTMQREIIGDLDKCRDTFMDRGLNFVKVSILLNNLSIQINTWSQSNSNQNSSRVFFF